MRIAVIGSRNIGNDTSSGERIYELICKNIPENCSEIISGGAAGVDTLAEIYANRNGIALTVIRPDYATYGRKAPLIRNESIIARAQLVLAFWDGASHGTAYTVTMCVRNNIPVKVISIPSGYAEND